MDKLKSLTPIFILMATTMINHICKENKKFTINDFFILLSPSLPTILPIMINAFVDFITFISDKINKFTDKSIDSTNSTNSTSSAKSTNLFFQKLKTFFSNIFNYPQTNQSEQSEQSEQSCNDNLLITLNCDIHFIQLFMNYIFDKKNNVSMSTSIDKLEYSMTSEKSMNKMIVLTNVLIPYNEIEYVCPSFNVQCVIKNNTMTVEGYENTNKIVDKNNIKHFKKLTDFIKCTKTKLEIQTLINYVESWNNGKCNNELSEIVNNKTSEKKMEFELKKIIKHCVPEIDETTFVKHFIICYEFNAFSPNKNYICSKLLKCIKIYKIFPIFDYFVDCSDYKQIDNISLDIRFTVMKCFPKDNDYHADINKKLIEKYLKNYQDNMALVHEKELKNTKNNCITFIVQNNKPIDLIENNFNELIDKINNKEILKTHDKPIKIFNTKIEKKETKTTIENPKYIAYIEKKKLLENNDKLESAYVDFLKTEEPEKEITNTITTSELVTKEVNSKFKSFDTTYLREDDKTNLINFLKKFRDGRELFDEYGLPNKLGIMLHGFPGTGKTTTIYAIASFLQKNVYYVNLNTIKSNDELQMVFDHIVYNSTNSGIIVFEDIDAMTNVVHDRSTTDSLTENDNLTLDYFLNLLQGSLTRDGTIFIATTNHIEKLDPAFYRAGRFDIKINMRKCDHYQIATIYKKFIGKQIDQHVLDKIPIDTFTPGEIIFCLINHIKSEKTSEEIMHLFIQNNV